MKLSKITISFGVYIIISAIFMRQVSEFFNKVFGENNIRIFIISFGLLAISYIVFNLIKKQSNVLKIAASLIVIILAVMYWQGFEIFVKRIHFLQYGLLGWLAARDLWNKKKPLQAILPAAIFIILIGSTDELFQKFIPWRVGDLSDVFADSVSGIFGIILYILR